MSNDSQAMFFYFDLANLLQNAGAETAMPYQTVTKSTLGKHYVNTELLRTCAGAKKCL